MATLRDLQKIKSNTASGAIEQTLNFLEENNISTEDVLNFLGTDSDRSEGRIKPLDVKVDEDAINDFVQRQSKGNPIPGASLTRAKDERYPWERPAQFASPVDALNDIESRLLTKEGMVGTMNALANGYTVEDLTSAMLYEDFKQGKYTPDVMLQVYEPTAIMIMAIGEKAKIDYKFSSEDMDANEEDDTIEQSNILKDISKIALQKGVRNENILPQETRKNLLEKTEQIDSLLERRV